MPNAIEQFYGRWVRIEANLERGSKAKARKTAIRTRALNENEIRVDFNFSAVGSSKLIQVSAWLNRDQENAALEMIDELPTSGKRIVLQTVFTNSDCLRIVQHNHPCDVFTLKNVLYSVSRELDTKT
jgi:hypothetical protein